MVQCLRHCEGEDSPLDFLLSLIPPHPLASHDLLRVAVVVVQVTAGHKITGEISTNYTSRTLGEY